MQLIYSSSLAHHGIKGMRWGIRRYQPYPSGSSNGGKEVGEAAKKKRRRIAALAGASAGVVAAGAGMAVSKLNKSKANNDHGNKSKTWERNVKQGKDKPNISPAEKVAKDANNATQESIKLAKNIIETAHKNKPKTNHAEGMSDQELRNRINRLRMEQEYNSMMGQDTSRGYDAAMTALQVLGSVATIGLATINIVATIKNR